MRAIHNTIAYIINMSFGYAFPFERFKHLFQHPYFLNVSNFFNYLTAIFLLSPRTDIGCENYNKTPLKTAVSYTHLDVYKRQPQGDS